jgi:DNA-binding NtrC family response regulator
MSGARMHQVAVLAVTSRPADAECLRRIFANSNWRLDIARTIGDAVREIVEREIPVVLCGEEIDSQPWEVLLHRVREVKPDTQIVVISRTCDDSLWGEVLTTGAFDVLPVPLEAGEVLRVVASAWRHWRDVSLRRAGVGQMAAHASNPPAGLL